MFQFNRVELVKLLWRYCDRFVRKVVVNKFVVRKLDFDGWQDNLPSPRQHVFGCQVEGGFYCMLTRIS